MKERVEYPIRKGWHTLSNAIHACRTCVISDQNKGLKVIGEGNRKSPLVLVGEAPGKEERKRLRCFIGRAGAVLNEGMDEVGLHRCKSIECLRPNDVYITNTLKCRPTERTPDGITDRTPSKGERWACSDFLYDELALIKPKVILAMGLTAAKSLFRPGAAPEVIEKMTLASLRKEAKRGARYQCPWGEVIITYHPSGIQRARGAATELFDFFLKDLRRAAKLAGLKTK